MNKVNIDPLMRVVEDRKLMDFWADTLFEMTIEEQRKVAEERLAKCIAEFENLMKSPSNNGSPRYRSWSVFKALGLPFKLRSGNYEYRY